jgi:hypothetical protein
VGFLLVEGGVDLDLVGERDLLPFFSGLITWKPRPGSSLPTAS